jgi:hypothetical protein
MCTLPIQNLEVIRTALSQFLDRIASTVDFLPNVTASDRLIDKVITEKAHLCRLGTQGFFYVP